MKPVASRRSFLWLSGAMASVAWLEGKSFGITLRNVSFAENPFKLGVASGDPAVDGCVLWTRLAPDPIQGGGMPAENVAVRWEVSDSEGFADIVQSGEYTATPQLAHSVHVEVTGLAPDRWYFYRFHAGDATSPIGRMRTLPSLDKTPERLRVAFASCQHFEHGYFTAYQHMVQEDLDMILHLGDYIYEYAGKEKLVRKHTGLEIISLDDYRNRLSLYKSDPHLQAAHAKCPWMVTWDDHEFDNNYANLVSEEKGIEVDAFTKRRAASYQAYYEHMPLRKGAIPTGPDMTLYRNVHFGNLAHFAVLDTRQYRSDQPNGDGLKPLTGDALNPNATMLGAAQQDWLYEQLDRSSATWNVLAQQVMMGRVDRAAGDDKKFSMDQWSGYDVPRRNLLNHLAEKKVANPVVLTGDIHCNWVNDLKVDFDDAKSPVVATEFVGTSISSGGDGQAERADHATTLAENEFVKFYNAQRGYVSCEITPKNWTSYYRTVPFVTKPGAALETPGTFVVSAGKPGAEKA